MWKFVVVLLVAMYYGSILGLPLDSKHALESDGLSKGSLSLEQHNHEVKKDLDDIDEYKKDNDNGNDIASSISHEDIDAIPISFRTRKLMAVNNDVEDEDDDDEGDDDEDEKEDEIRKENVTEKTSPGIETDTDNPQGKFLTLDQLRAMVPGPGVQPRTKMLPKIENEVEQTIVTRKKRQSIAVAPEPDTNSVTHGQMTAQSHGDRVHLSPRTQNKMKLSVGNQSNQLAKHLTAELENHDSNSRHLRHGRGAGARKEGGRGLFHDDPHSDRDDVMSYKEQEGYPRGREISYTERLNMNAQNQKYKTKERLQKELNAIEMLMKSSKNKLAKMKAGGEPYFPSKMAEDLKKIDHNIHIRIKEGSDGERNGRPDGRRRGSHENDNERHYDKTLEPYHNLIQNRPDQKKYDFDINHTPHDQALQDTDYNQALRLLFHENDVRSPRRLARSMKILEELLWMKKESDELKTKARVIQREMLLRDFLRKFSTERKEVGVSARRDGDEYTIRHFVEEQGNVEGNHEIHPQAQEIEGKTRSAFSRLQNDLEELKLKMNARQKLAGLDRYHITDEDDEYPMPSSGSRGSLRPLSHLDKEELEADEGMTDFEKNLLADIFTNDEKRDDADNDNEEATDDKHDDIINNRPKRSLMKSNAREQNNPDSNSRLNKSVQIKMTATSHKENHLDESNSQTPAGDADNTQEDPGLFVQRPIIYSNRSQFTESNKISNDGGQKQEKSGEIVQGILGKISLSNSIPWLINGTFDKIRHLTEIKKAHDKNQKSFFDDMLAGNGNDILQKLARRFTRGRYDLIRICIGSNSGLNIRHCTALKQFLQVKRKLNTSKPIGIESGFSSGKCIDCLLKKFIAKLRTSIRRNFQKLYKQTLWNHRSSAKSSRAEIEPPLGHDLERMIKYSHNIDAKTQHGRRNVVKMTRKDQQYQKLARKHRILENQNTDSLSKRGDSENTQKLRTRRHGPKERLTENSKEDSETEMGLTDQFHALLKLVPESQLEKELDTKFRKDNFIQKNAFDVSESIKKLDNDEEEDKHFLRDTIEADHILDEIRGKRNALNMFQRGSLSKTKVYDDVAGFTKNGEGGEKRIKRSENSTNTSSSTDVEEGLSNETDDSMLEMDDGVMDKNILRSMDAYEGHNWHGRKREAQIRKSEGRDNKGEVERSKTARTKNVPDGQNATALYYRKLAAARDTLRFLQLVEANPRSESEMQILNNMAEALVRDEDFSMWAPLNLDREQQVNSFAKLTKYKNAKEHKISSLLKEASDDFKENVHSRSAGSVDGLYLRKKRSSPSDSTEAPSDSAVKEANKELNTERNKQNSHNKDYFYSGDPNHKYSPAYYVSDEDVDGEDDDADEKDDEEFDFIEIRNSEDDEEDDPRNQDDDNVDGSKETGIEVDDNNRRQESEEPFAFVQRDKIQKKDYFEEYLWGAWSSCSVTCGVGQRFRATMCGQVGQPCTGRMATTEAEVCSDKIHC